MIRKILYSILFLFIVVMPLYLVHADPPGSGPIRIENPLRFDSVQEVVFAAIDVITTIGFYVAVFFIIYSGFLFVKARGNPGEVGKAREAFMWTVIGTAVLLGANVIARVIQGTINQVKSPTSMVEYIDYV